MDSMDFSAPHNLSPQSEMLSFPDFITNVNEETKKVLLKIKDIVDNKTSEELEDKRPKITNLTKDQIFETTILLFSKLFVTKITNFTHENKKKKTEIGFSKEDNSHQEKKEHNVEKKNTLCKFFQAGKCKFVKSGGCNYLHGNICKRYRKNGSFENGCKLGDKCKDVHITLCKYSRQNKECPKKENCYSKFHIKNPKHKLFRQEEKQKSAKSKQNGTTQPSLASPIPNPFLGQLSTPIDQRIDALEQKLGTLLQLLTQQSLAHPTRQWEAKPTYSQMLRM